MFDSEPFRASCVSRVSAGFSFTLTDGQKNSEEWNKRTWPDFAINKSSRKWNFIFFRKCCCQRRYVLPAYETNCSESLNHLWFVFSILCRLILFWFDFLFLSFHFLCAPNQHHYQPHLTFGIFFIFGIFYQLCFRDWCDACRRYLVSFRALNSSSVTLMWHQESRREGQSDEPKINRLYDLHTYGMNASLLESLLIHKKKWGSDHFID